MRTAVVMRPAGWFFCVGSADDSPSAGVQCVYTLSVVTVVGLGLVSVEVWERTKCEVGYGAGCVCENVEKRETETADSISRR